MSQREITGTEGLYLMLVAALVTVAVLVILGIFVYPIHVALASERPGRTQSVPVRHVVLAVILVTGLVGGAAAVRVTDTHPPSVSTAPTPLPGDATDAYATALNRTAAEDHRVVVRDVRDDQRNVQINIVDHTTRQYWTSRKYIVGDSERTGVAYADSGVSYNIASSFISIPSFALGERQAGGGVARALPSYWHIRDDYQITSGIGYGLPRSRTGTWTTVAEENGTQTLELTDGPAVFDALRYNTLENGSYETAVVRMRVDTDRGVILGGHARLNATHDGTRRVRNLSYVVETGDNVEASRPSILGPRSLGEWTWDIFAY